MSLFENGPISTTEDLRAYESSILDVASGEGVDLTVKLALAQREVGAEIHRFLASETATENRPPAVRLSQVAITDELRQWHALRTLALTFRDAHHNELNDRYHAKWREYAKQASAAAERLFEIGVGIVNSPVLRASVPAVGAVPGVMPPGIFEIRVTWQNAAGQEGSPSERAVFSTQDGSVPVVDALMSPGDGEAWNVYAGPLGGTLTKQNATSIPPGQPWTAPATGFTIGARLGDGQAPESFLRKSRSLVRG